MKLLAYKRTDRLQVIWRIGYLVLLLLGYGFVGWLLAAFQAVWLVWLGTLAVTLHLIRDGAAALVLSWSWVVALITIAALTKAWVSVWNARLPLEQAQLWAQGLLLIWLGASLLLLLLVYAPLPRSIQTRRSMLAGLTWVALGLGGWLYQVTTIPVS